MHLYALWAPLESDITYVDGMTFEVITDRTVVRYDVQENAYTLTIEQVEKPGYAVVGWYIYQNENQNANWNDGAMEYEPHYKTGENKSYQNLDFDAFENHQYLPVEEDGNLKLTVPAFTFGNITLVAKFERQYADLTINKEYPVGADYSVDENQVFVFTITGTPYDKAQSFAEMRVVVQGSTEVTLRNLPVGSYTVQEEAEWSWRYANTEIKAADGTTALVNGDKITAEVTANQNPYKNASYEVIFTNTRDVDSKWLSGDNFRTNWWKTVNQIVDALGNLK